MYSLLGLLKFIMLEHLENYDLVENGENFYEIKALLGKMEQSLTLQTKKLKKN